MTSAGRRRRRPGGWRGSGWSAAVRGPGGAVPLEDDDASARRPARRRCWRRGGGGEVGEELVVGGEPPRTLSRGVVAGARRRRSAPRGRCRQRGVARPTPRTWCSGGGSGRRGHLRREVPPLAEGARVGAVRLRVMWLVQTSRSLRSTRLARKRWRKTSWYLTTALRPTTTLLGQSTRTSRTKASAPESGGPAEAAARRRRRRHRVGVGVVGDVDVVGVDGVEVVREAAGREVARRGRTSRGRRGPRSWRRRR